MYPRKITLIFLAFFFLFNCIAQNIDEGKIVFLEYLECLNHPLEKDISQYFLPSDLEKFKEYMLPFFISLGENAKDKELIAYKYLLGDNKDDWSGISKEKFYSNFFILVNVQSRMPDDIRNRIGNEIVMIKPEGDEHLVEYRIFDKKNQIKFSEKTGIEKIKFENGKWYVRLREDPKKVLELLKQL